MWVARFALVAAATALACVGVAVADADPAEPCAEPEVVAEAVVDEPPPPPCAVLRGRSPAPEAAPAVVDAPAQPTSVEPVPATPRVAAESRQYDVVDLVGKANSNGTVDAEPEARSLPVYAPGALLRLVRATADESEWEKPGRMSCLVGGSLTVWAEADTHAAIDRLLAGLRARVGQTPRAPSYVDDFDVEVSQSPNPAIPAPNAR